MTIMLLLKIKGVWLKMMLKKKSFSLKYIKTFYETIKKLYYVIDYVIKMYFFPI